MTYVTLILRFASLTSRALLISPDVLSTIPYDLLDMLVGEGQDLSSMKAIRLLRLLRIAKLVKLVKANRIIDTYRDRFNISGVMLESVKLGTLTLATCHWMACVWVLLVQFGDPDYNWLSALEDGKGIPYRTNLSVYVAALHFAVMTLTTVGYGDIAPQWTEEYVGCIALMLLSGVTWAFILGSLTTILSSLDPHGTMYKQKLDDINVMMQEMHLPPDISERVRRYWRKTQHIKRLRAEVDVIGLMSPKLQV